MKQRDVLWASFPYSNTGENKHRPVLVLSNDAYNQRGEDVLVCAITSNLQPKPHTLPLEQKDLEEGTLPLKSRVRCDKLFTIEKNLLGNRMGRMAGETFNLVVKEVIKLIGSATR